MRNITIKPVLNGYLVTVGCQDLAYTSREKLIADLTSYLNSPEETEKRILTQEGINKDHTMGRTGPECEPRAILHNSRSDGVAAQAPTPVRF